MPEDEIIEEIETETILPDTEEIMQSTNENVENGVVYLPADLGIVAPDPGSQDQESWVLSNDTYLGNPVYYNSWGDAMYYDSNGFKCLIYDVENIVKGTTEEIPEESTEEVTTEETTEESTEEETTEEMTEDSTEDIVVEYYTEVPFFEKPFTEYSTSEGLLLLIFIILLVWFFRSILFD